DVEAALIPLVVIDAGELVGAGIVGAARDGILRGHVQRDGVGAVPRSLVERADLDRVGRIDVREVDQGRVLVGDGDLVDDLGPSGLVVDPDVRTAGSLVLEVRPG